VERVVGTPFQATPDALAAIPVGLIVQRMLNNLKAVYLGLRDFARGVRIITRLCQLCPNDVSQRRDLGVALLQSGRPGPAIDQMRAYLESEPPPVDSKTVRELLDEAEGLVARWN
jgi:regulator of sirC expression with transglutaminase-like and TPR domain